MTTRPSYPGRLAAALFAATFATAPVVAQSPDGAGPVIVLVNPNSNEASTQSMVDLARAEIGDAARVTGVSNAEAPPLLTTPEDMANAIPGVVRAGVEAAEAGAAAIIVSAFSDPGLEELRAEVEVPVFGIGEEVFHAAAEGGRPFGIVTVTPDQGLIDSFRDRAAALGYADQYRGVRVTPGDPTELVQSPERLDAALAEAARASINEDGAEAVIMGGGPLSAAALRIQPEFEVPLVVAVTAAARAALRAIEQPSSEGTR
jgi:allantoin racemase